MHSEKKSHSATDIYRRVCVYDMWYNYNTRHNVTSHFTWQPVHSSDTEKSDQPVQFQGSGIIGLGFLALEDETDMLSRNVGKKLPLLAA
jgi:hypothetical protein